MNKVVTINLNGRAYQLDEGGFDALRAYLDEAQSRLADDPGKAEIVADLEQAIAEKCDKLLSPQKSVVTTDEIKKVIDEMGPVEGDGAQREKSDRHSSADSSADSDTPKRLYRIQDGEMVAGVANGLAAYFGVDVVLVRVIFVILLLVTGGGFGLAYFAMMMLIPEADTMQDKAAAYGEPFNAQELVNRAKLEYARIAARFSDSHDTHLEWRKWKHEMKRERKHGRHATPHGTYNYRQNPLLGILRGAIAVIWILALVSLISTGAIFGWIIPAGVPIWISIILLFVLYHAVTGPMRAGHNYSYGWDGQNYNYDYSQWDGIGDGLTILFLAIAFGWAYLHVPQFYAFAHHPIQGIEHGIAMIKAWLHR
jgi:phage shock protein PspC (stress-responsive transcriptional regulator)